jgi:hypothetical protein
MANVLEFALGLQTSNFLSELGLSSGRVLSFAAVMEGVKFAADKMWSAIGQGAALQGLSDRTNQSAESLYRLQMGFEGVGVGAEGVPMLIMRMQKSLSGVNEMGEKTGIVFERLGLSITTMRAETAEQQINDVAGALAKLGTSNATGVATALFGRGASGDILQIARGVEEYKRVMDSTRSDASVFGAMASSWREIKGDAEIFGSHMNAIWAAIATGITPELHKIMTDINTVTQTLAAAIAGAFQFGKIEQLLTDALKAAMEQGAFYGERAFSAIAAGFGAALVDVLEGVVPALAKMIYYGLSNALTLAFLGAELLLAEGMEKLYDATGMGNSKLAKNNKIFEGQMNQMIDAVGSNQTDENKDAITGMVSGAMAAAQDGFKALMDDWKNSGAHAPTKDLDKFTQDLKNFSALWIKAHPEKTPPAGSAPPVGLENKYKPEFTSLEKMGFVMGGLQNPMQKQVDLLARIAGGIDKLTGNKSTGLDLTLALTHAI